MQAHSSPEGDAPTSLAPARPPANLWPTDVAHKPCPRMHLVTGPRMRYSSPSPSPSLPGACRFVAEYITYEALEDPLHPPQHLPSPHSVLTWQAGDAFDCASLLASLLLGAGFDAYVVVGYAPKATALADQSRDPCPLLASPGAAAAVSDAAGGTAAAGGPGALGRRGAASRAGAAANAQQAGNKKKYQLRPRPDFRSKVLAAEEAAAAAGAGDAVPAGTDQAMTGGAGAAAATAAMAARRSSGGSASGAAAGARASMAEGDDGGDEEDGAVPGRSKRVHAWVLVLPGRREVRQATWLLHFGGGGMYALLHVHAPLDSP
jgi:hypothetical protein